MLGVTSLEESITVFTLNKHTSRVATLHLDFGDAEATRKLIRVKEQIKLNEIEI